VPCGLQSEILESEHELKKSGQMGQDKTTEFIRRYFWEPMMNDGIVRYIQSCREYCQNKAARHKSYGRLQPLELAYSMWSLIVMDFIRDLPLSNGCDQLWVILDQ
jgi:hypothetical protein